MRRPIRGSAFKMNKGTTKISARFNSLSNSSCLCVKIIVNFIIPVFSIGQFNNYCKKHITIETKTVLYIGTFWGKIKRTEGVFFATRLTTTWGKEVVLICDAVPCNCFSASLQQ
jgi:hypothetical protein